MSNIKIKTNNLSKQYKMYTGPKERLADTFKILPLMFWRKRKIPIFKALQNVNVEIRKGERIGIVGRNGAGKSTFLKLVAGNITPNSGSIEVNGKVQALMELGTGFHPEFTGRENIYSSLIYQGFSRSEISKLESEIIEFAEIGDFIDQPVKSYSAGMYARLAFSVSTSVKPDILIVDEILGAGDSYFASKSIERMKKLTSDGTTVLFVSHDMSSVEMLCDRSIWIERGQVVMDGTASEVSKAYAQKIREMTEERGLKKNLIGSRVKVDSNVDSLVNDAFFSTFKLDNTLGDNLDVKSISFTHASGAISIDVGGAHDVGKGFEGYINLTGKKAWTDPINREEKSFRSLRKGYRGEVCFKLHSFDHNKEQEVFLNIESFSDKELGLPKCSFLSGNGAESILEGRISGNTISYRVPTELLRSHIDKSLSESFSDAEISDGTVDIKRVRFLNENGDEKVFFKSFEPLTVEVETEVYEKDIEYEVAVTVHAYGQIAFQALSGLTSGGRFIVPEKGRVVSRLHIPELTLGRGSYLVSIGVFPFINYNSLDSEKTAHILHDRRYTIEVEQPEDFMAPLGFARNKCDWELLS